jgi:hypothetical protein
MPAQILRSEVPIVADGTIVIHAVRGRSSQPAFAMPSFGVFCAIFESRQKIHPSPTFKP